MDVSSSVRRFIHKLKDGEIFATRDVLEYGPRAAVDKVLQRAVRTEIIFRVARGVFVKVGDVTVKLPTVAQVAEVKARAFGKQLFVHGRDAAHRLGLVGSGNTEPTYTCTGCTSSFACVTKDAEASRIYFRSASAIKRNVGDSKVGLIFKALYHIGKFALDKHAWSKATSDLNRLERESLRAMTKWMPRWMSDLHWFWTPHKRAYSSQPYLSPPQLECLVNENYVLQKYVS